MLISAGLSTGTRTATVPQAQSSAAKSAPQRALDIFIIVVDFPESAESYIRSVTPAPSKGQSDRRLWTGGRSLALDIEHEVHDVAVLDDVFLAFDPQRAFGLGGGLRAKLEQL